MKVINTKFRYLLLIGRASWSAFFSQSIWKLTMRYHIVINGKIKCMSNFHYICFRNFIHSWINYGGFCLQSYVLSHFHFNEYLILRTDWQLFMEIQIEFKNMNFRIAFTSSEQFFYRNKTHVCMNVNLIVNIILLN